MDAMGTMRDLDQIREHDDAGGSSRLMSLAMGGLATACVLFAVGVLVGRESGESQQPSREDPLARLDQLAQQQPESAAQITWPERLTGPASAAATAPSATAPAAPATRPSLGPSTAPVTGSAPALLGSLAPPSTLSVRLSEAPLAAPTGVVGAALAAGTPAAAGSEGAFSVQVSSARSITSAQQFAARLRERGHRAFVAPPVTAPNGVVWHRVRIGPFATAREAAAYRVQFEARERMPTIVVRRDQEPFHAAAATAAH